MTDEGLPDDGYRYEKVETFDIDDGSLAMLSPEEAFVLGVEWQSAWSALARAQRHERPIEKLVHRKNVARLTALADRNGFVASAVDSDDKTWALMRFLRSHEEQPDD